MNKKTMGLLAVIATIIFCGCPGLIQIISGLSSIRHDIGISLFSIGTGVVLIAIPVGLFILVSRIKPESNTQTQQINSPSQPASLQARKVSTNPVTTRYRNALTVIFGSEYETYYNGLAKELSTKGISTATVKSSGKAEPSMLDVIPANVLPLVIGRYVNDLDLPDTDVNSFLSLTFAHKIPGVESATEQDHKSWDSRLRGKRFTTL